MTKDVSAAIWRLIPQEPGSELEEGPWVKDLSWLIGKVTLDEWGQLTVALEGEFNVSHKVDTSTKSD